MSFNNIKTKLSFLPDKLYIQLYYMARFKRICNFKNPKTFNEKLQWLKLNDHNPKYSLMVDKFEAKKIVCKAIGEEYIIPTYGIWDKFEDIDFDKLPNQFVLKCTHDSGGLVICKDKTKFDISAAKKIINECLKINYYYVGRERPYKNVRPRIIAEKYMEDSESTELRDYKFFCFDGKVEFLYLSEGLSDHETARISFITKDWKIAPFKRGDYNGFEKLPTKPEKLDKMIELAEKLSKNIPHLRVDFYYINNSIYFGELTFFTCSGFIPFSPPEWDLKLGDLIKLPEIKNKC